MSKTNKWQNFFEEGASQYVSEIEGSSHSEGCLLSIKGFSFDAFEQGSEITLKHHRKRTLAAIQEEIDRLKSTEFQLAVEKAVADDVIKMLKGLKKKISKIEP